MISEEKTCMWRTRLCFITYHLCSRIVEIRQAHTQREKENEDIKDEEREY